MLKDFLKQPKRCVYALVRDDGVAEVVSYSINMGSTLARIYDEYFGLPLSLRILTVSMDIETLKLHTTYWRKVYGVEGEMVPLQYRVVVEVMLDLDAVLVSLVNRNRDKKVVGVFDSKKEADLFVQEAYGENNMCGMPVYACNVRTRTLMQGNRERGI